MRACRWGTRRKRKKGDAKSCTSRFQRRLNCRSVFFLFFFLSYLSLPGHLITQVRARARRVQHIVSCARSCSRERMDRYREGRNPSRPPIGALLRIAPRSLIIRSYVIIFLVGVFRPLRSAVVVDTRLRGAETISFETSKDERGYIKRRK